MLKSQPNSRYRTIAVTFDPIFIKFETMVAIRKRKSLMAPDTASDKIQDGGGRHLEFRKSTVTFEPLDRFLPHLTPQLAADSPRCLRTPTLIIKQQILM